jgi:glycerophosphoryl diester phosphodiesterase
VDRRRIFISVIAGLSGAFVAVSLLKRERRTAGRPWLVNFAHRGASARAPENTLEAFRLAVEAGAGGLTLDEVRRLDAGYSFSSDGGRTFPYRGRGVRIPTLAEVYEEYPDTCVNADIKEAQPEAEEAVFNVIQDAAAEGRTLVASTDHAVLRRFRRVSGGRISTGASRREIATFYVLSRLHIEALVNPAYEALQVPVEHRGIKLVTPRFLGAAHSRGVRVDVWTINDVAEMRRLLDLGVDVIMTDRPEVLESLLRECRR